jgi:hypothetical protein
VGAFKKSVNADFASLREAFKALSEIYQMNGVVVPEQAGVKLSRIPRSEWWRLSRTVSAQADMIKYLISGTGQRASVAGRKEVVLSVIAGMSGETRTFEIAAFLVVGRGAIQRTISISSKQEKWRDALAAFVAWDEIEAVIPAAEGNNQRAMIGLVLQLAGIGRGKLEMIEADIPEEVDEAAQMIKGADWLKAGLPRFESAAGEALWYLMRIRSVHARMIKTRKQGYYTAMGLAALRASGVTSDAAAQATGMSPSFVEKLTPGGSGETRKDARLSELGEGFGELDALTDGRAHECASRVWKGAAIYAHILERRIRHGAQARRRLADGDDLVQVASDLGIARRDLVRVLSVRQEQAIEEKSRFIGAIIDPGMVRQMLGA